MLFVVIGYQRYRQTLTYKQMLGNIYKIYRELAGR
jgi:hypothetical protein